jgi:hypothetical protein
MRDRWSEGVGRGWWWASRRSCARSRCKARRLSLGRPGGLPASSSWQERSPSVGRGGRSGSCEVTRDRAAIASSGVDGQHPADQLACSGWRVAAKPNSECTAASRALRVAMLTPRSASRWSRKAAMTVASRSSKAGSHPRHLRARAALGRRRNSPHPRASHPRRRDVVIGFGQFRLQSVEPARCALVNPMVPMCVSAAQSGFSAEAVGFEPTRRTKSPTSFQVRRRGWRGVAPNPESWR